jgi:hypothetical protein
MDPLGYKNRTRGTQISTPLAPGVNRVSGYESRFISWAISVPSNYPPTLFLGTRCCTTSVESSNADARLR